ncbi:hypothetical protein [Flavitalea sp.]|nr:hypothetical protein [Flavitalea sp.]
MAQLKVIVNKLNRRGAPIADFVDKSNLKGTVAKGYTFVSEKQIINKLGSWYMDRDGYYYWGGGLIVLDPSIFVTESTSSTIVTPGKATIPLPSSALQELPLSQVKCKLTADWLDNHFGDKCEAIVEGSPFTKELLYAIACQETAIYFYDWTKDHTPAEVLARCVFDASGDVNGTRKAFPKNTAAFVEKYGQQLADMLIDEANKTRAMRGFGPKRWVYAGYGIFQYDIQAINRDEAFFTQKQWYNIDDCLTKVMQELNTKWKAHPNDLFQTIRAYNGSGPRAENYANNVLQFLAWINNKT